MLYLGAGTQVNKCVAVNERYIPIKSTSVFNLQAIYLFCFPANKTKPSSEFGECRTSPVHNDVTLVGGINAGKFTDLGDANNISICTQRCCMKDACDVAFMLEGECYGVSCVNDSLCETRPARNPARYNPKIAYVYHDKKKDQGRNLPN